MNHRPGWTLLVASIAAFMTSLDQMVVTTALPRMRADLGGTIGQLEWTMNAFYLAFACLLLAAAGLGDRFGRRRVLVIGLVVFGLSSLAAAAAPGLGLLIAARAVQGGASAAVLPLTLTVISEAYPPDRRGKAIGIWSSLLGAGGVLGPLVGGVLVEAVGWRGIFWVNVPIAAAVAIATRIVVTETHGPRHRLDLQGLILATAGSLGLAWGLARSADDGWGATAVWGPLIAGLALLAAFIRIEHTSAFPLMPTGLFRVRSFSATNCVSLGMYASLAGSVFFVSQFFQTVQHASPLMAALRFAPWPAPALVLAPLVGTYAARLGNRPFLVAGMTVHTIAMAWFALVAGSTTPYAALVGPLVLSGIGIATVFPAMSAEVMASVPPERMGVASGINGSIRELGGVLGVALAATAFAHAGGYDTTASFTTGFVHALWVCVALAGVGLTASLATGRRRTNVRSEVVTASATDVTGAL